jgi:tetratricopeptide (TPR) repeat protein
VDAGLHLLGRHDVNGAEQLLFQAIRRDPHLPVAYYDLGVVFQSQGLDPAALLQFMHADSVAPDYVPALYDEAVIEAGTHPPYAMSLYRRIIAIRPDSPTALLNLGLLEHAAHDDAAALGHLRMAVQLEPALAKRLPTALRTEVGK